MKQSIRTAVLVAAIAAVPLVLPSGALAQYRLNQDGKALDANNRVGSGGNNPTNANAGVSGNDIVTGNVSGGKEFRGNLPYRNAKDFRGNVASGQISDFIKNSSSADPNDPGSSYKVQTFYGSRTVGAPPAGFQAGPIGSGVYEPIAPMVNRQVGDPRMGAVNLAQPVFALPTPGELMLPGPVDPTAGQQYITATPLTGIRQINGNDLSVLGSTTSTQYNPLTGKLTPQQIDQARQELNDAGKDAGKDAGADKTGPDAAKADPNAVGKATSVDSTAVNTNVAPSAVSSAITPGAPGSTDQGIRNRLTDMVKPEQQSAVYAELRKRLDQSASDQNVSDAQAARDFNAARREKERLDASKAGATPGAAGATPAVPGAPGATPPIPPAPVAPGATPGGATPGATPGATDATPGVTDYSKKNDELMKKTLKPGEQKATGAKKPVPYPVRSLATGVKAKGLADVLTNAENLMKDGKFTSALDQYGQAEEIAPNNPLIKLGRANAELGASYYARADQHLRDAFTSDPALLVGQYDLNTLLGEKRVATLQKDLKDIAKKDQRETRPLFLLAYIAYNTGHEQNAEAFIDLADKRSGGTDKFFDLLRKNWALPGGDKPAAPDLNK